MTYKEAKRILSLQRERITPANGELCQALDIAIEALENIDDLCENLAFYINERNRLKAKIKGNERL